MSEGGGPVQRWTTELSTDGAFERFFRKLPKYEQAVLDAAIRNVLQVEGINICADEWGKSLGSGLHEFRVRRSLNAILSEANLAARTDLATPDRQVSLRVFCHFHGSKVVLLLGGYDKKKDSSERRQQREIKAARKRLRAWRREN